MRGMPRTESGDRTAAMKGRQRAGSPRLLPRLATIRALRAKAEGVGRLSEICLQWESKLNSFLSV
jgi:hypothetical protein